jgi:MFS family permease
MGSLGGVLLGFVVGLVLTHLHSYSWLFVAAGLLHPLSFLLVMLLIPRIQRVAPRCHV